MEAEIKAKLGFNYNSVRKAFLELDDTHDGYISAEELARFLGATNRSNFDFTLMEILVKMNTKGMKKEISYNDFCTWFGSSIEPTETFYFRHDSKKNPQYEANLQKQLDKNQSSHAMVSHMITKGDMKQRFIQKAFN